MFPGMQVHSDFFDGVVGQYTPSVPELLLGIGGSAMALMLTMLAIKVLPFLPDSLADSDMGVSANAPVGAGKTEAASA
jgi:molybdopterin-containing oxidoreductase family membrane subunit